MGMRSRCASKWTSFEGGNGYRYPFIPKDEIWIDAVEVRSKDIAFVIYHEAFESRLMKAGRDYDAAHKRANGVERELRLRQKRESEHEYAYGTEPPGSGWEYAGELKWRRKKVQSGE